MGIFRNNKLIEVFARRTRSVFFLMIGAVLLMASYSDSQHLRPCFFIDSIQLLELKVKNQFLANNSFFHFQSHNKEKSIQENNNVVMPEDCFNEIDDDGDGLVDCYDDDCAGIGSCDTFHYQYTNLPNCQFVPPTIDEFKVEKIFQTDHLNFPIDQRSGIVVGDMDGDGIPEIVSKDPNPGRIQIYSGVDGTNKQSIVIPTNHPFSQPAIADVDRNGKGDIFVTVNNNQLRRYEYGNSVVVWATANNISDISSHSSPQVADFDQDGRPEVYVGNRIFDAITGTRYAIGKGSTGKAFNSATKNHDKFPIAIDVFAPGDSKPGGGIFGTEAEGLELVAGNQVYAYVPEDDTPADNTQDKGTLTVVSSISGGDFKDGFTSFADVDGDSQVDIIVMAAGKIYIWNPRTQTQIGSTYDIPGTNTGGRINVGDFDNDGMVEIGTAGRHIYVVLEYDSGSNALVIKWQKTGLDDGSQRTGSTLFDFEGDGINEVVYSEEAHLYIWRGTDGTELSKVPAQAGTRTEYPLVADVNDDGAAEIIITAQNGNGPGFSGQDYVQVYRSSNTPWVTARKVWNQHGYFVTNINDDLTVPIEQQDPLNSALNNAYNGFLVQTTILNATIGGMETATPAFAAPDAVAEIDSITIEKCPDLVVHLTIKNEGSDDLPSTTPISFYDQNPTIGSPTLLGTGTIGMVLTPSNETNISVTISIAPLLTPREIFSVINDPGTTAVPYSFSSFPISGVGECDFNNNLDNFTSPLCLEICADEIDNDSDGLTDEPNIMATTTSGCSGTTLPTFTTDEAGGTWEIISSIGSMISNTGMVTLGTNHSPTPDIDTIVYLSVLCNDTILVSIFDDEAPSVACPGDQTLTVDNTCQVTIPDYTGLATPTDNCSDAANITLTQSPASGSSVSIGLTTIIITAIDEAGNSNTCQFQLRVTDEINPSITCPADTTLFVDNNCDIALPDFTSLATVSDNCSMVGNITVSQSPAIGTTVSDDNATQLVTLTARDESGNTSTCDFTVTLQDTLPPTISCPADLTINADTTCQTSIVDYTSMATVSDNCAANSDITVTQSPAVGTILIGHGNTETITLYANDGNGNVDSCSFTITLEDNTIPSISCPVDQMLTVNTDCEITIPDYTGMVVKSDNCETEANIILTQSPVAGTVIGVLDTMVKITITADDSNGNTNNCSFFLTLKDEIDPIITCPADVTVALDADCKATLADYTSMATVNDNCTSTVDLTIAQSPEAGQIITSTGTTTVTLTVEDESGNTSECTFDITFEDATNPSLVCPTNQTITVDGDCPFTLLDYTESATYSDNCTANSGLIITQTPVAGTMISGNGTTQNVIIRVEDARGNFTECTFMVTLEDTVKPSITCPANQNVYADSNCEVLIPDFTGDATITSECATGNAILVTQNPAANTMLSGHGITQTITLTATDGSGNSNECDFIITVIDTIQPIITCPSDSTIYADVNCENTIPDLLLTLTAADNCTPAGSLTITQSPTAGTPISGDSTNYTVIFTVDDNNGNQSQCSMTVELVDTTVPNINCLTDQMLFADADCQGILPNYAATIGVTDNCADGNELTITQNPVAGTVLSGHNNSQTITITATDNSGNSAQCSFEVLLKDTIAPSITCPADITLNADANCEAIISDYTSQAVIADNCTAGGAIIITQSPAVGTILSGHNTSETITLIADDGNGNKDSCSFLITLKDVTPPSLTCPTNQVLTVDTNCEITIPDYTGIVMKSDNCETAANITLTQRPAAGMTIGVLDTTVLVFIIGDDNNGNIDSCSFFISLKDEIDPMISCPTDLTISLDANCEANLADYTSMATVSDNCRMTGDLSITQNPIPNTLINSIGITTITLTIADKSGNTAECMFDVTYEDTTNPILTCPANDTLGVDGVCAIPLPDYRGNASYADNCTDNTALLITQNPTAGTMISGDGFDQLVTITVTDESGNMVQCDFTVALRDITNPSISCPGNETIYADNNCQVLLGDYTNDAIISSNCSSGSSITVTQNPLPNTQLMGHGTTQIITLTATDGSGNSTECTFEVTVADTINPQIDCPADSTIYANASCENTIPNLIPALTYQDNCTETGSITASQSPVAGTPISSDSTNYTITFTVNDGNGNQNQCSMTIELIDTTSPVIICINDQTVYADATCQNTVPNYIPDLNITDNCAAGNDLTISQSPVAGTPLLGHNDSETITITATDNSGNSSQCTFEVVLKDTISPSITCPADIILNADGDCEVAIGDYTSLVTIADNCTAVGAITVTQNPAPGTTLSGHGDTQIITLTANDGNGNSSTCNFTISLQDVTPPVLTCLANQVLAVDTNCEITIPDYTSMVTKTDNCLTDVNVVLTQKPAAGTIIGVLDSMVKITIIGDDTYGNIDSCDFVLTLKDEIAPQITCPANIDISLDANCQAIIADYTSLATVTDNCTATNNLTVTQSPAVGTLINSPTVTTITLVVEDGSGNTSNCTFEVNYEDTTKPSLTCPADTTLSVDGDCPIALADYTQTAIFSDNCSINSNLTVTQNPVAGTIIKEHGTSQIVTITVRDESGNSTECNLTVHLEDDTPPALTCHANQTLYADGTCGIAIPDYTNPTITSACATGNEITVGQIPTAGTIISGHQTTQTITLTAKDKSGNTSQCTFEVMVLDTINPQITCPTDSTIYADAACENTIPNLLPVLVYQDNCTETGNMIAAQSPIAGTPISGDSTRYTVIFTVDDGNGNQSQCSMTVELIDTTAPMITCPIDQIVYADATCQNVVGNYISDLIISDNCAAANEITISQNPIAGTVLSGHNDSEIITMMVTDNSGNSSQCTFEVVLKDTINPSISCPVNQQIAANVGCVAALPDYTNSAIVADNCTASNTITVTQSPEAGSTISGLNGSTMITLIADDGNGNTDSCHFNLELIDETLPTYDCLTNQTIYLDNACSGVLPDYRDSISPIDNCSSIGNLVITQFPAPGTSISEHDTEIAITLEVTDESSNTQNCTFTLILKDTIAPAITCPSDKIFAVDNACDFEIPDYRSEIITSDNCQGTSDIILLQNPIPGTIISNHNTEITITFTADDGNGNTNTCDLLLTVKDSINPVINCPPDISLSVDADCERILPDYTTSVTVSDNCTSENTIIITQSPIAGTVLSDSRTVQTIKLYANDGNGNIDSCDFQLTLTDTIPPVIDCPEIQNVYMDGQCEMLMPDYTSMATFTDNCLSSGIVITQKPLAGTLLRGNDTIINTILFATDFDGNMDSCVFQVILKDTIDPVVMCLANQNVYLDSTCFFEVGNYANQLTISDNCTVNAGIEILQFPPEGVRLTGVGSTHTITLAVIDETGNETQCDFEVTLLDTIAPVIVCPDRQLIDVDGACEIEIPDYTDALSIADNCTEDDEVTITQSPTGIMLSIDGTVQEVTLTAIDESGNTSTCQFIVELVDRTIPAISCPGDRDLNVDADCMATIPDYSNQLVVTNDCDAIAGITVTQDPLPGTVMLTGIGTEQEVTLTATDASGNSDVCTFKVRLIDTIAPEITCLAIDSLYLDACFSEIPDYSALVTATDNCSNGAEITISQSMAVGVIIIEEHGGIRNIQIYAEDEEGNVAICEFPIIFIDTFPPFIECPMDTITYMDDACEYVMPDYTNFVLPLDNCADLAEVTVTQNPIPGTVLKDSDTTYIITLTADDSHGNQSICSFNLTLKDTIAPMLTCPTDQIVAVNENCQTSIPDLSGLLTIVENCTELTDLTIVQNPSSGTILNGVNNDTTITFTVMDKEGNASTCSFNYQQTDQTAPNIICPSNMVLAVDDDCQMTIPDLRGEAIISDNCSANNDIIVTQNPIVGTIVSGHGNSSIITITATDEAGNTASCNFTLTYQDTIAPTITCPANQPLLINDQCEVALPDYRLLATATNTCNSTYPFIIEQVPAVGTILSNMGTKQEVLIIASDTQDNKDTCRFEVVLIFDLPPLIVREDVKIGERIEICMDHPCLTPNAFRAYDKSGTGRGIGAGGNFDLDTLTGCLNYALNAPSISDQDSFRVTICDLNGFCDTINYRLELINNQAYIVDPCVCLNNESSNQSGDGQFYEYVQITGQSGETWKVTSVNGFYENPASGITTPNKGGNPYPLNPITIGTSAVEIPRGNGISDYYLAGLHIDEIGYSISFSNGKDALSIANICSYDASCRQGIIGNGEDGLPPEIPSCGIVIGDGNTPALTTLENCIPCQFRSNNTDHLYQDTSSRDVIHTICPSDEWKQLKVNFNQFELAVGDTLYVYDGKTIVDSLIGKYSGTGVSETGGWVTSNCNPKLNPSGCLTFQFITNGDNAKGLGWKSEVACVDKAITLTPPNDLNAKLTCKERYAIFDIKPATLQADCGTLQDSQIVRIINAKGEICLDTCLAGTDIVRDTFSIGNYLVTYKLKSDTVKETNAIVTVQTPALVCNDEINVPLGSACSIMLTPDDLLENACDTTTDTMYYVITLIGKDKNRTDEILAMGGGKGGNYPVISKEMIDQCGNTITAKIERQYYNGLDLTFCNNGIQEASCEVKVNIIDQSPPIFTDIAPADTFVVCNVDLTQTGLGLSPPRAIDNCDSVKVDFVAAKIINAGNTACDTTKVKVTWSAVDNCGNITTVAQNVVLVRPTVEDIVKTGKVTLSCGGNEGTDVVTEVPGIKIGRLKNDVLIPSDTIPLSTEIYTCGYILENRDIFIPANDCGKKIFRYWTILDWCAPNNGPQAIDTTVIEFKDTKAPTFVADAGTTALIELDHFACTYDISKQEVPTATDNCSTPTVRLDKIARIENGTEWLIPEEEWATLSRDSYKLEWIAEDDCFEQLINDTMEQIIVIEDVTKPFVVCADKINLAIGKDYAVLHYRDIDSGSSDACGIVKYEVSRDEISWDSIVTFYCEDIHQEAKVYLRATDAKGNQNTCWMRVNVEDKIAPICSDLPTIIETCDEGHFASGLLPTDVNENGQMDDTEWIDLTDEQVNDFDAKYGNPICSDNVICQELVIQQQYQLIKKACGEGTIKRRFRAIDWDGEGRSSNWSAQTINIEYKANWGITLPADWNGDCGADVPNSEVLITNGVCDLMGYEVEEKVFTITEAACLKVVRTFTIINWCKYPAGGETVIISRTEDEHGMVTEAQTITSEGYENVGKLEYVQILKLKDNTLPVITIQPVNDCISTDNCLAEKTFSITAEDCNEQSPATLKYKWQLYQFQTEALIAQGTGSAFTRTISPSDRFVVKWEVADNCGNIGTAIANHYFVDCQKPVPYCLDGVGVELPETGKVQIWASDIDAGSFDNCTTEDLQIRLWHESLENDAPTHIASIHALPENITFDCRYLGKQTVRLYVIDAANNWAYCTSYINVQDNMGRCENDTPEEMAIVSGTIMDWKQQIVESVSVKTATATATATAAETLTKADGQYNFELEMYQDYTIRPSKDDHPLNGVSTFDLVLMVKHILGVQAFENPYQMIAADVNQSGTITAFDMVQIRQLILNIRTEFANSPSWRFVEASYEFTTDNPVSEAYPSVTQIADLRHDLQANFVAIKLGDVNGNAKPNSLVETANRITKGIFEITTEDKELKAGEAYSFTFSTKQLAEIQGYQFTLGYEDLKVEKLHSGIIGIENFGLHKMDEGMITTSWNQASVSSKQLAVGSWQYAEQAIGQQGNKATELFSLHFTTQKDGKLSNQLSLLDHPTSIEAYDENGALMEVQLTFTTPFYTDQFELFQNQPNPFKEQTEIGFYLPEDSEVQLILRDELGRVLKVIKMDGKAGNNQLEIAESQLPNGFIYYELVTKFGTKGKKMLRLR